MKTILLTLVVSYAFRKNLKGLTCFNYLNTVGERGLEPLKSKTKVLQTLAIATMRHSQVLLTAYLTTLSKHVIL